MRRWRSMPLVVITAVLLAGVLSRCGQEKDKDAGDKAAGSVIGGSPGTWDGRSDYSDSVWEVVDE